MLWAFRLLLGLNLLMLAAAFLYQSPGEDPAGAGLRLGAAVVYALTLGAAVLIYRFAKSPWVRVPMLALMTLPVVSILYGIWLSA